MKKVISKLIQKGINLDQYISLEFFARDGSWQTLSYSNHIKKSYLWELDKTFEIELIKNFPESYVSIGDSFELAKKNKYKNKFNFLVFDNPQGIYGKYCEHFEALELSYSILSNEGVIIFNINKSPYDLESNKAWKLRRDNYYGFDSANISSDQMIQFYSSKLKNYGFNVNSSFEEERNKDYLSYLVFIVSK